jgi:thymidylate synthase
MTSVFHNVDEALPEMAAAVLAGYEVGSRLGERTLELLHQQIILNRPWMREVLAPHRHVNIAAQIAETMWVLAGRDDVEFLTPYLPRAADFSDDGKVWRGAYGPRLRRWLTKDGTGYVDQVQHVVDLLKNDRSSRRAVISIYDPLRDTPSGKDIPCNDFLSFISRNGRLDLSVFVRSNDLIWGWSGINAFEWSALQEIVAGLLGLNVGNLVFNTTSLHIYDRHWDKAKKIDAAGRYVPTGLDPSPRFDASAVFDQADEIVHPVNALDELISRWFDIEARLRRRGFLPGEGEQWIQDFPEPMMRSWLRVIAWYWSGDNEWLVPLNGTRLYRATEEIPQSIRDQVYDRAPKPHEHEFIGRPQACVCGELAPVELTITADVSKFGPLAHKRDFVLFVDELHREKSAAYGDSWKKRGELFSIIPNIARKVDRLASGGTTADETSADTAIDLLVYLIKYRLWLASENILTAIHPFFRPPADENIALRNVLEYFDTVTEPFVTNTQEQYTVVLTQEFDALVHTVEVAPSNADAMQRATIVNGMLQSAFKLARLLWEKENGPDFQNPYRNIRG